jgi:uncharacterized membrane protein YfcA
MEAWQLLILTLLGLVGGALSGLVGIGGAAVFVPSLVYVAGWDIKEAVGASLVITVFTALSGTMRGIRSENPVSWRTFALLSCVVAPSTLVGVAISRFSPETLVQLVFATFLIFLAWPTARGRSQPSEDARNLHPTLVLLGGIGIGILAGLTGIGGAALMIPLIVLGFGLRFKTAIATSLAINFLTGIAGAAGYIVTGVVQLGNLPTLIVGAVFGAWLGVGFRDRIPEIFLRRGFALLMVFVAVRIIIDTTNGS